MEYDLVVTCEGEGERKWVRLVVDSVWLHPHAGDVGCRSEDGGDKVGVHD